MAFALRAQPPPANTEVYLARLDELNRTAASQRPGQPADPIKVVNISNNAGYDNQPSFTPDRKSILFTSNRDGKQTDIYRYDLERASLTQLTHTTESEYSPLVTPDGRTFSVIRVEADGAQRLWRFDLDGTNPRLVLENVKPVGYHAWIDATHLALFVLGANREPATLQFADTKTGTAEVVTSKIGRTLALRPGSKNVTYVDQDKTPWTIGQVDRKTRALSIVAPLTEGPSGAGVQDFAWDPSQKDGQALMAWGTRLMAYWPLSRGGRAWRDVADFNSAGVARITRLAVSPDGKWLALVAEPVAK